MTANQLPPNTETFRTTGLDAQARPVLPPVEPEEMNLGEWLDNLWEGRWLIAACFVLFTLLGVFNVWRAVPVFQVEAMVQIQGKQGRVDDPAFSKMEGLFEAPEEAQTEAEIVKSNLVLGRTVQNLKLDLPAFDVPARFQGKRFHVKVLPGGNFELISPFKEVLGSGQPGTPLALTYDGEPIQLAIKTLVGKPGQDFIVVHKQIQAAIAELRLNFDAFEKGKMTNVIGLTFKTQNPTQGTAILNEIIRQFIRHKVEHKGGEAAQTLALLESKMPVLKARLEEAESRMNAFRSQSGSVDLTREAEAVVQESASLGSQISALKQKKEELLRTYKENADVVVTVNEQIRKLQAELNAAEAKARALPNTQQTVVRLSRDVQVNQELYTALLNNIQQLQVAASGQVGTYDLVDSAMPGLEPLGAKPAMQVAIFAVLGLLVGGFIARMRRVLRRGVKDHRLIEGKLGIPVLITVPHSRIQEAHALAIRKREDGTHLLAQRNSEDLATESLRSLRTTVHFSMRASFNNVLMVTGPAPGIGKSFISANYAAVLAQAGTRVLLVDADLRKGNLHHYFGIKTRKTGLADVLFGRQPWEACVQKTELEGLDLLTTGILPPNPAELLMSGQLDAFLEAVAEAYTFVIIDVPPLLAVTDATIIGSKVGAVLLVAKYGQHPLDELQVCQQRLEGAGIGILGCVFNDVQQSLGYLGQNYRYAYHYTYKG